VPQAARDLGVYNDDTDSDVYAAYRQRVADPNDQLTQDLVAPREHKQFMQEITERNPVQGTATMAMAVPYSAAKALGVTAGGTGEAKTSRASVDELFAAAEGYGRGMKKFFSRKATPKSTNTFMGARG
jgi:hypothetical protein